MARLHARADRGVAGGGHDLAPWRVRQDNRVNAGTSLVALASGAAAFTPLHRVVELAPLRTDWKGLGHRSAVSGDGPPARIRHRGAEKAKMAPSGPVKGRGKSLP